MGIAANKCIPCDGTGSVASAVRPGILWGCGSCDGTGVTYERTGLPEATKEMLGMPTDAAARKAVPVFSGVLKYFPDALVAVAALSKAGNDQHNPGKPLHWDRSKSGDECDALTRHLLEAGTIDTDGQRHSAKVAWRALANLQKEIEAERK